MRRSLSQASALLVLMSLVLLAFMPSSTLGWGSDGHRIVAEIAQSQLTPTALAAVLAQMPNGFDLPDIATWPDSYDHNSEGAWSEPLHYVDLYDNSHNFTYDVCVGEVAEYVGCVVTAVENFTAILSYENKIDNYTMCAGDDEDPDGEPCPLSFFIHFLGDIHQPLHVGYASDEGGNQYYVDYINDGQVALHAVWDWSLIATYEDDNDMSWWQVSQQMVGWVSNHTSDVSDFTSDLHPASWADESFSLARRVAYNNNPGTVSAASYTLNGLDIKLKAQPKETTRRGRGRKVEEAQSSCGCPVYGEEYYDRNIGVVLRRLVEAGVRAAAILNKIYS